MKHHSFLFEHGGTTMVTWMSLRCSPQNRMPDPLPKNCIAFSCTLPIDFHQSSCGHKSQATSGWRCLEYSQKDDWRWQLPFSSLYLRYGNMAPGDQWFLHRPEPRSAIPLWSVCECLLLSLLLAICQQTHLVSWVQFPFIYQRKYEGLV